MLRSTDELMFRLEFKCIAAPVLGPRCLSTALLDRRVADWLRCSRANSRKFTPIGLPGVVGVYVETGVGFALAECGAAVLVETTGALVCKEGRASFGCTGSAV